MMMHQPDTLANPTNAARGDAFTRHTDSVLCCSLDKNIRLAVTGGIDDTAFVWDINTRHVIFECVGHKESVVAADFSANSTYVATGDLNGYVQVRNTTTGIRIFEYDIDEINWVMWHNTSEFVLLAGTTKGDFWMWNVNDPAAVKTFPSYGSPITAARLLTDGMRIATSYGDGAVRVFDLKTRQTIFQLNDANQSEIISLDLDTTKDLIAVGYIDSRVKLVTLAGKIIGTLACKAPKDEDPATSGEPANTEPEPPVCTEPIEVIDEYTTKEDGASAAAGDGMDHNHDGDQELDEEGLVEETGLSESEEEEDITEPAPDSVESVLFSPCGNYLATASNSGSIYIWEISSLVARCELHTGIGITRCAWTDRGNYITGCLDGNLRIYDKNLALLNEIPLHSDQILDVAYKGSTVVTASEDKSCRVTRILE